MQSTRARFKELNHKLAFEKITGQSQTSNGHKFEGVIGESSALKRVLSQVRIAGPSDTNVLILGETGTGKELVARAIHRTSKRKLPYR